MEFCEIDWIVIITFIDGRPQATKHRSHASFSFALIIISRSYLAHNFAPWRITYSTSAPPDNYGGVTLRGPARDDATISRRNVN